MINDAEARVVSEIFDRCAKGQGLRAIAHALNAAGAASPRAQQGRPNGWCPSSVREALNRPLYRGEIVWNRTRKRNAWGIKQQHDRPTTDWLTVPAPGLRIEMSRTGGMGVYRAGVKFTDVDLPLVEAFLVRLGLNEKLHA